MKKIEIKKQKFLKLPDNESVCQGEDEEYAEAFVKELDAFYPFKLATNQPLKNSVSGIFTNENGEKVVEKENFLSQEMYEDALLKSAELGTLYHNAMQCYELNESDETFLDKINVKFTIEEKKSLNEPKLLTAKKLLDEKTKGCKRILKEQKFMMYVPVCQLTDSQLCDKVLVQGIVDLMVEFDDSIILIDYKTNKTTNAQVLLQKYSKQLELYKMAIELSFKKTTKAFLYVFSLDDFLFLN